MKRKNSIVCREYIVCTLYSMLYIWNTLPSYWHRIKSHTTNIVQHKLIHRPNVIPLFSYLTFLFHIKFNFLKSFLKELKNSKRKSSETKTDRERAEGGGKREREERQKRTEERQIKKLNFSANITFIMFSSIIASLILDSSRVLSMVLTLHSNFMMLKQIRIHWYT